MNISQKNLKIGLGVLLVVVVAGLICFRVGNRELGSSVVYLATGEVYVGDLSLSYHKLELRNSYILGTAQDPADATKQTFQLNPIKEALWAPEYLVLNRRQVVLYGPLSAESAIAKKLAEQNQ